jgi:hypothetical protein
VRGTGLSGILLALTLACGGGGSDVGTGPVGTKMVYTAPADISGWWLKADAASTPTSLVLDLMPPPGAFGQGVTLTLTGDAAQATWHAFRTGVYLQGLIYTSGTTQLAVASPEGPALRIVAGQSPTSVTYGTAPVLQLGLDLTGSATKNTTIPLAVSAAGHLTGGVAGPITVQPGTLQVQ